MWGFSTVDIVSIHISQLSFSSCRLLSCIFVLFLVTLRPCFCLFFESLFLVDHFLSWSIPDALLKNQIRKGLGLWICELLTVKFHERHLVKILLDFLLNFKSTLFPALYFVLEHDPLTTIKELFGSDFRVISQIACIIDTRDEIFGEVCFLLPPSEAVAVEDLISLVCCLAKTAIEETLEFFLALLTFETMSEVILAKIESFILIAGEGLLVGVGSGGGCE